MFAPFSTMFSGVGRIAYKPAYDKFSTENTDGSTDGCSSDTDEKSFAHTVENTVVFSCTEILTTVGCHGGAERRHGLSCDIVDFRSGCKGSNHTGTKHVDIQ